MSSADNYKHIIVVCGNTLFDANPLGAAPLSKSLSRTQHVIYVEPPFSHATMLKKPELRKNILRPRLRKIEDNLWIVTPMVLPGKDRRYIHHITSLLLRKHIRSALKKVSRFNNTHVSVVATSPVYYPFISRHHTNIMWVMDDYVSQPELIGVNSDIVSKQFSRLIKNANHIVCASHKLAEIFSGDARCHVIENGADEEIFTFPSPVSFIDEQNLPKGDFCLYVGGINARVDIDYLEAVALTGIPLVLAGPLSSNFQPERIRQLFARNNVTYLGSVANIQIGALMNRAAVGIVPYIRGVFNEASMPLKIPEYLMSGLPVVSSALPFATDTDHIYIAKDANQFAQLTLQKTSESLTHDQRISLSRSSRDKWSWTIKSQDLIKIIDS